MPVVDAKQQCATMSDGSMALGIPAPWAVECPWLYFGESDWVVHTIIVVKTTGHTAHETHAVIVTLEGWLPAGFVGVCFV
jgi:hypothetical protein